MNSLSLSSVDVRFDKLQALCGVDLTLNGGEAVMLVGPNGAGKSTLLRVLLGLVRPGAGSMTIDGVTRKVDRAFRREIGYLPEAVAFSENLTGRQVLRFFAHARGVTRKRVDETLERVGLAHAAKRRVRGYSRGMRQRLGLSITILSDPTLLILDEPTGGLDQQGLDLLWELLLEWRQAKKLVVIATHDLTLMERRVDRVCVLRSGKKIVDGTPEALRQTANLPNRVVFDLAEGSEAFVEAVQSWPKAKSVEHTETRLAVFVARHDLLGLMDIRADHRDAVTSLSFQEPGMDAVYEHFLQDTELAS